MAPLSIQLRLLLYVGATALLSGVLVGVVTYCALGIGAGLPALLPGLATGLVVLALGVRARRTLQRQLRQVSRAAASVAGGGEPQVAAATLPPDLVGIAQALERGANFRGLARLGFEEKVREAQRAQRRAEAAERAKGQFLANMSHEIRTPMTAILGFVDLLRGPDLSNEDRDRYFEVIQRSGWHLIRIINDILDLSKAESGHIELEPDFVSPVELLNDIGSLLAERAAEQGLAFSVEYVGLVPARIWIDATRLRQILLNLLGNAMKFTEAGSVRLIVRMLGVEESPDPCLRLDIIDTGSGLDASECERVFEPFVQADSSMSRRFGGTGLGLTISKRLAKLLGGTLELESRVGQGSTFRLTVPTGPLAGVELVEGTSAVAPSQTGPPESGSAPADPLSGRVLLAEDMRDSRLLLRRLLERAGLDVEEAENGRLALGMATRARELGEPYDLILMDMQMPEMDGYQATSRLRQDGYPGRIVALTAHAMSGDRAQCLAVGCDDYISKPVDREALLATLRAHLGKAHAE